VFVGYQSRLALLFTGNKGVRSVIHSRGRFFRLPETGTTLLVISTMLASLVTSGHLRRPVALVTILTSALPALPAIPMAIEPPVFLSAASKNLQPVRRTYSISAPLRFLTRGSLFCVCTAEKRSWKLQTIYPSLGNEGEHRISGKRWPLPNPPRRGGSFRC